MSWILARAISEEEAWVVAVARSGSLMLLSNQKPPQWSCTRWEATEKRVGSDHDNRQ